MVSQKGESHLAIQDSIPASNPKQNNALSPICIRYINICGGFLPPTASSLSIIRNSRLIITQNLVGKLNTSKNIGRIRL